MATIEDLQQQLAALTARVDGITAPPTDYYTSRYSGEEADNGIARALPGGEIDQLRPGLQLLRNWYLTHPVNQRGQSSYSGNGYTIDGYYIQDAYNTLQVIITADGLVLSNPSDTVADQSWFIQKLEFLPAVDKLTTSIYVDSITGTVVAFCGGEKIVQLKPGMNVITAAPDVTNRTGLWLSIFHNSTVKIKAVKLELGSVSTLANDPPADYGTELLRCQRYFEVIDVPVNAFIPAVMYVGETDACHYNIPYKVIKRTTPTVSFLDGTGGRFVNQEAVSTLTAHAVLQSTAFSCGIVSNFTPPTSKPVSGWVDTMGRIAISADL